MPNIVWMVIVLVCASIAMIDAILNLTRILFR